MPRPGVKTAVALIDKDIRSIRPTYVDENIVTLPLYHSAERTVRRFVKDQETVEIEYITSPVILLNDGAGIHEIILKEEGQTQQKIGDVVYTLDSRPARIKTAPSQNLTKTATQAVDPSVMLDKIKAYMESYVDFADITTPKLVSLWTLGTYIYDCFPSYGFLWAHGEKGCGKTRLLRIISLLSYYGMMAAKISAPALYRTVHVCGPTVAIDEAEKLVHRTNNDQGDENLIQILNASYKRGGTAMLVDKSNDGMDLKTFEVYSPRCLASIRGIERTLEDRSIMIIMKLSSEKGLTQRVIRESDATAMRDDGYRLRLQQGIEIYKDYANIDESDMAHDLDLSGRSFEVFGPLVYLCKRFKPEWYADLMKFVRNYEEDKRSLDEGTLENDTMLAIYHVICGKPDVVTVGGVTNWKGLVCTSDVALKLLDISPEHDDVSHKSLGWVLKRMGFNRIRKIGTKYYREINGKDVLQYLDRHKIDYPIFGSVPVGTVAVTPIEQFKEEVKDDATNYP